LGTVRGFSQEERHRIEQSFHDEWARSMDLDDLLVAESFEAETAIENRLALEKFGDLRGKQLLDLGCGAGETSAYFALRGDGVRYLVRDDGRSRSPCRLVWRQAATAQDGGGGLELLDAAFPCVFGNGGLHHVELLPAIRKVHRVLRPGGIAVFVEPLAHNPVIRIHRQIAKDVRPETEAPLRTRDIQSMRVISRGVSTGGHG
jgi:SAM-dependent methyltransferase